MFLGQPVEFTRSAQTLSNFDPNPVGAVHFRQTGITTLTLSGDSFTTTYDIREGYNVLTFRNVTLTSLAFSWVGAGTIDWTTLKAYKTDISLANPNNNDHPITYQRVFTFPENSIYSTEIKDYGVFSFEWRNLDWERVTELKELFDRHGVLGNPRFWLIPRENKPESYEVLITSSFNFYPSSDFNYYNGASGALVFETLT